MTIWNSTLRRNKGLPRSPWNRSRLPGTGTVQAPAAFTARRARKDGEFPAKVKLLIRARAGYGDPSEAGCEACGTWLGRYGGECQHRAARGSGGCRDSVINGPANGALMCRRCHRLAESRDEHMGMDAAGFWIRHGTTAAFDPRYVPIMWHCNGPSGMTLWLAEDGKGPDGSGYLKEAPEARAALWSAPSSPSRPSP